MVYSKLVSLVCQKKSGKPNDQNLNEPNENVLGFRNQTQIAIELDLKTPKSKHLDFGHLL